MANKIIGMGVALRRGDGGGPETFTKIAQLTSIDRGGRALDVLESTNMDITDSYKTFMGGNVDPGTVAIAGFYDEADAEHIGLQTDMDAQTLRNFELAYPAPVSKTVTLAALVQSLEVGHPFDGIVNFTATLKLSGKPTVA